jgi:hypothetical protein
LSENGPRYDWSARVAAEIINLHLHSDDPPAVIFSKLLFLVLEAMYKAEEEISGIRYEPSEN